MMQFLWTLELKRSQNSHGRGSDYLQAFHVPIDVTALIHHCSTTQHALWLRKRRRDWGQQVTRKGQDVHLVASGPSLSAALPADPGVALPALALLQSEQ